MPNLCSQVLEEVVAEIESQLKALPQRKGTLLDVGCWDGSATRRYAAAVDARPTGIEVFHSVAIQAAAAGVGVVELDLEKDAFPWEDGSIDFVVCNQVCEHLKNIWLPLSEMFRVLRPGGTLVFSVPNLASLHNRVLLALGRQPTSIRTDGPHVRGFTFRETGDLLGAGFEVQKIISTGFHPFPARKTKLLCRLFPALGHTTIAVCLKDGRTNRWAGRLNSANMLGLQTFYAGASGAGNLRGAIVSHP